MTIQKGKPWGEERPFTDMLPRAVDDADLARQVRDALDAGVDPVIVPGPGDLLHTLGHDAVPVRSAGDAALHLPMDLAFVSIDDGPEVPFVAHLVVRGPLWAGPGFVAMNAAWVGERYLGPRAHPNDGVVDTTEGSLPAQVRWHARSRARSGTHLPHPALSVRRVAQGEVTFASHWSGHRRIWVDGVRVGRCRHLRFRVVPDAFTAVV